MATMLANRAAPAAALAACLAPRTVAVVGAGRTGGVGAEILRNLLDRFRGRVFPVNPNATAGAGRGTSISRPEMGVPDMLRRPVADFAQAPTDSTLGVRTSTDLGQRAQMEMERQGGGSVRFRQGLDRAIGTAQTPEEMDDLNRVARMSGISDTAFNRRRNWWETNRA